MPTSATPPPSFAPSANPRACSNPDQLSLDLTSASRPIQNTTIPVVYRRLGSHHWTREADTQLLGLQLRLSRRQADRIAIDGGELIVEDTYGIHSVKLPAGHMVIYPASSLHHVKPVTRGARIASFFWIQSMIREDSERTLLFDLDTAIQQVNRTSSDLSTGVRLTGVYHNLLRRWAEA